MISVYLCTFPTSMAFLELNRFSIDIISEQFVGHFTFCTPVPTPHTHTHSKTALTPARVAVESKKKENNKSSGAQKTSAATISQVSNPRIYLTQWESNLSATQTQSLAGYALSSTLPLQRCLSVPPQPPLRYFLHYPIRCAASCSHSAQLRSALPARAPAHERERESASSLAMWRRQSTNKFRRVRCQLRSQILFASWAEYVNVSGRFYGTSWVHKKQQRPQKQQENKTNPEIANEIQTEPLADSIPAAFFSFHALVLNFSPASVALSHSPSHSSTRRVI